jgi:putative transposase
MDRLVQSLRNTGLLRSHVSAMARDLDEAVREFRERPLNEGPYAFLAPEVLTRKVREAAG